MALAYDIVYTDGTMDANARLPRAPATGTQYARCTNGEEKFFVPANGTWVEATREVAIAYRPPGRPRAHHEEARRVRSIRLNDQRWEKLKALGPDWLERAIDRAKL